MDVHANSTETHIINRSILAEIPTALDQLPPTLGLDS